MIGESGYPHMPSTAVYCFSNQSCVELGADKKYKDAILEKACVDTCVFTKLTGVRSSVTLGGSEATRRSARVNAFLNG